MSNTRRNVSEWWQEVANMVAKAEARDKALLEQERKPNGEQPSAELKSKLEEIKSEGSEYKRALRTYKEMATVGIKLEEAWDVISPGMKIKKIGDEGFGGNIPIQKIAGPLSLELAEQYLDLQNQFVPGITDPKSKLLKTAMEAKDAYRLVKEKADALDAGIQAYKLKEEKETATKEPVAGEEKAPTASLTAVSLTEEKNQSSPEAAVSSELNQEEFKVQEVHAAAEEKKEPQLTTEEKEQLNLLNQIKAHHELYNKFNLRIINEIRYNTEGSIEVKFKYEDIERDIQHYQNGKRDWKDLQKSYEGSILYFPSKKTKAENEILSTICHEERKFHKAEIMRLCENLKVASSGKISIDTTTITTDIITKNITDIEKAPQARQAEEERKKADELKAAEQKRRVQEEEERKKAEEKEKISADEAKRINDKSTAEMQRFHFYKYVETVLAKNNIKRDIFTRLSFEQRLPKDHKGQPPVTYEIKVLGREQYRLNHIKKENQESIEKDMKLYQTNTAMTKAQLDFLILLEGMDSATKSAEDKRKIRHCITYMQEELDTDPSIRKDEVSKQTLAEMQTTLKEKLKPATRFLFFTAGGPLKDLTNALNSLVKEEAANPKKVALTKDQLNTLAEENAKKIRM